MTFALTSLFASFSFGFADDADADADDNVATVEAGVDDVEG